MSKLSIREKEVLIAQRAGWTKIYTARGFLAWVTGVVGLVFGNPPKGRQGLSVPRYFSNMNAIMEAERITLRGVDNVRRVENLVAVVEDVTCDSSADLHWTEYMDDAQSITSALLDRGPEDRSEALGRTLELWKRGE